MSLCCQCRLPLSRLLVFPSLVVVLVWSVCVCVVSVCACVCLCVCVCVCVPAVGDTDRRQLTE